MPINPELLLHPSDKAALQALKAIPGFPQLMKAFVSATSEQRFRIVNKSSNLQLSEEQMPEYYNMLPPICEKLGIPVPELYLEMDVVPNAYSFGDTNPFIVITTGLLETMPDELIPTVLAHECGHIACHHTLYRTMGILLLNGMGRFMTGLAGLLTVPIELAFAYWMRCSEFSADRAAVVCDGTGEKMAEVCFRFAGYDKRIMAQANMEAFIRQAEEYRKMVSDDLRNQMREFMLLRNSDHPLNAIRALECREWAASEQVEKITAFLRYRHGGYAIPDCELPAPESSKGCVRKQKEELRNAFEAEGFRNVELVRTLDKGSAVQSGQVVSALIDGERPFENGEWFPYDAHIVLTYYEPESAEELAAAHPGQIMLANNAAHYLGMDHRQAALEMQTMGFTNVVGQPMPVRKGLLTREGAVCRITVDGSEQFRKGQWVPVDAQVWICYNWFGEPQPNAQQSTVTSGTNTANHMIGAVNQFMENVLKPKS